MKRYRDMDVKYHGCSDLPSQLITCGYCGRDVAPHIGYIINYTDRSTKRAGYIYQCPHCKNRDQSKMNVARRTCGYIGTQFWNQGRTQEIQERVLHL